LEENRKMSVDEKLGHTMMMDLIEGELEERKLKTDRRQKDCEESMKEVTEEDRRAAEDRRTVSA